jgi:hypothetical protein
VSSVEMSSPGFREAPASQRAGRITEVR